MFIAHNMAMASMRLRKLARAKSTGNTPTAASLPQALATQNPRNLRLKCSGIVQHLGPEARPPHDDVVVLDCRRATGVHRTCPPAGMDAILSALFHQSLCLCAGFGHAPAFWRRCGDAGPTAPLGSMRPRHQSCNAVPVRNYAPPQGPDILLRPSMQSPSFIFAAR